MPFPRPHLYQHETIGLSPEKAYKKTKVMFVFFLNSK